MEKTKSILKFKILITFLTSPSPRFSESGSMLACENHAEITEKSEKKFSFEMSYELKSAT